MSRRTASGRVDLLRAVVALHGRQPPAAGSDGEARCAAFADLLELHRPAAIVGTLEAVLPSFTVALSGPGASAPSRQAPLAANLFVLSEMHVAVDAERQQASLTTLEPLTADDCAPRQPSGSAPHLPLVPARRLWPALQRALAVPRPGALDCSALVAALAGGRLPRRLPRRRIHPWGGELLVVRDVAHHLLPYARDYAQLLAEVRRRHGRGSLRTCLVEGSPAAPLALDDGRQRLRPLRQMPTVPAAAPVLILGDLGLLAPGGAAADDSWRAYLRRLGRAGARALAWLPASPRLVPAPLRRAAQVYCLDGRVPHHPLAAQGAPATVSRDHLAAPLHALLTRLACGVRVEPGLEALLWGERQQVVAGERFCAIAPAHVAVWRERFAALPAAEQRAVLAAMLRYHAFRGRSTEAAELLVWHAHAGKAADADFTAQVGEARRWFARFARYAGDSDGEASAYAADLLARNRGDRIWFARESSLLAPLWLLTGENDLPAGLDAGEVARALADRAPTPPSPREFALVQRDDTLRLAREAPAGSRWPLLQLAGDLIVRVRGEGRLRQFRVAAGQPQPLLATVAAERVELLAGQRSLTCERVPRPAWAREIGRDHYGVYLDALIAGVVQRLRWIEPGEFLMGSPVEEPGRLGGEGPQHRVRLTRGFWLADTACTQALWQAVCGNNPSEFKDDARNPVERVSWDDVQDFLEELRRLLPGAAADLPSEAEWEYACRAGTTTPFHFGATIDTRQANYDGRIPSVGGAKGECRQRTLPVKSFPANAWGLYEMHGNVWEWCVDGQRPYTAADCEDPRGSDGDSRVVRGGSWRNEAGWLRSAFRSGWRRGWRFDYLGFRFSLRSISGRGAPAPEGPERSTV